MQKNMQIAIFYGILWGFLEASLGGILHFTHFPFTGQVMGAIAFFILMRGMRKGLPVSGIFLVASIAATIKLVDLYIFPGNPGAVIKPAMAILSQGLAFALVTSIVSFPWKRGVYLLGGLLLTGWTALGLSHFLAAVFLSPLHELQHIYQAIFITVPLMVLVVFCVEIIVRGKNYLPDIMNFWRCSYFLFFLTILCKFIFKFAVL